MVEKRLKITADELKDKMLNPKIKVCFHSPTIHLTNGYFIMGQINNYKFCTNATETEYQKLLGTPNKIPKINGRLMN